MSKLWLSIEPVNLSHASAGGGCMSWLNQKSLCVSLPLFITVGISTSYRRVSLTDSAWC